MVGFSWVSQLSSTPRRFSSLAARTRTAPLRSAAKASYHRRSATGRPRRGFVGGNGRLAPREPRKVPTAADDRHLVEDDEPGQVDLGRPDRGHLEVEDRRQAHVLSDEEIAELHVPPQQRRRRLRRGQVGATPLHGVLEDGRGAAFARPGQVARPSVRPRQPTTGWSPRRCEPTRRCRLRAAPNRGGGSGPGRR